MSSTDSEILEKVVGMPLESVVDMTRNEWTASIGIGDRHGPDYALLDCETVREMKTKTARRVADIASAWYTLLEQILSLS